MWRSDVADRDPFRRTGTDDAIFSKCWVLKVVHFEHADFRTLTNLRNIFSLKGVYHYSFFFNEIFKDFKQIKLNF